MKRFNEYAFLEDLKTIIKEENPTDVWELVNEEIERECIHSGECFEIVRALHITDWKDNEFGEITNITQLAFAALYEYVSENLEVEAE